MKYDLDLWRWRQHPWSNMCQSVCRILTGEASAAQYDGGHKKEDDEDFIEAHVLEHTVHMST